ncbi:MAG: ATP-binding protein [Prevotellaceae bacterium]|nr:ATP-binding protein [Prevotellaceae bacterium]
MEIIIGRQEEIRRLSEYVNSDTAEFLVIYGRRRVGKTFLVKQFFQEKFTFYFSGAENVSKQEQLFNFSTALNEYSGTKYPLVDTWQKAFVQLKEYLQSVSAKGRKVVFIDEMPCEIFAKRIHDNKRIRQKTAKQGLDFC